MNFSWLRMLALVLVVVCAVTFSAPARAEADALTAIAITSAVVVGVILVLYLIVANVAGDRIAESERGVWVACVGSECRPIDAATALAAMATAEGP